MKIPDITWCFGRNMLLLLLPLLCATSRKAEESKPEFLLIGTFHEISDSLSCNWQESYQKLINYKPDQIAVEEVMPTDSMSLIQNFGKDYRAVWDSLALVWVGENSNISDSIRHYEKLVAQNGNPAYRLQLWKYYHLGLDVGNRDFQTFIIARHINQYSIDSASVWGKYFWQRHNYLTTRRSNSEFYNIIYPLAMQMGIGYLHPTDDKATYPFQSEAYEKFAEELAGTSAMKKMDDFWKEFIRIEAGQLRQCKGLPFVNSEKWLERTDYGQAHILEDTHNAAYKAYTEVWYKRNKSIANRIIASARQSKAKKMAVFYGYMHVFPVKKYLEEQGYKVKLLGNI